MRPTPAYPAKQLQCWSQGEDEENRWWIPVHDYPNERFTSETLIRVKKPLSVISNGPLLEVKDHGDGSRTWHHRIDVPHPAYLVSIAVGDWASRTDEWEGVQLGYHVPRARAADMDRSFANTPKVLAALSELTGLKYPYPTYHQTCVTDFMWGGMENIAATTLTEDTLHDARAHSDWQSDGLVAHEAAHQWFGDYVTCRDWSDIWLNEGFATYYAALVLGRLEGPERELVEFDALRQSAVSADAGDKRRPVVTNAYFGPNDLFDGHAYAKGAMVLRALSRELGPALFAKSVQTYLADNAASSVDTNDFVRAVEKATGRDVSRFFAQWIHGAGQPELELRWSWSDGRVLVDLRQVQALGGDVGLFDVPLDVQVLGEGIRVDREVRVGEARQSFVIDCPKRPEAVVVDAGNWLLRTLAHPERKDRETLHVLAHAPSLGSRIEAARALADSAGSPVVTKGLAAALASEDHWALRKEAATSLGSSRLDEARDALLACVSSTTDSRVRSAAAASLGAFLGDAKAATLASERLVKDDSYAVRAACAKALAAMRAPQAAALLEAALAQPSHREEVAQAAFEGLKMLDAPRLRGLAKRGMALGKPARSRNKASSVWAQLASESDDAGFRKEAREELVRLLDDPLFSTRSAAIEALATLGDPEALPAMRRFAASVPEARMRRAARESVAKAEAARDGKARIAELAKQLAAEKSEREKLEQRLKTIESRLDAAAKPAEAEATR